MERRRNRNCDGTGNRLALGSPDPDLNDRCPWATLVDNDGLATAMSWYSNWSNAKLLPYPGGLADQPLYVTQAIMSLHSEITSHQNREAREQRDRMERLMKEQERNAKKRR